MSQLVEDRQQLRRLMEKIVKDYDANYPPFDELRLPEHYVRDEFAGPHEDYTNFLTLTAAVDYMKETAGEDGLWQVLYRLYRRTPWVFNPTEVTSRGRDALEAQLSDISMLWGEQDLDIWYTISQTLANRFEGETTIFLESQEYDALNLRRYMRQNGAAFPYIKGDKINLLWLRLMHEEIHGLDRIEQVDIPVDVRILDITNKLMGTEYTDCKSDKYEVRTFWGEFSRDFGFVPVHIDQPLWLLSKNWETVGRNYIQRTLKSV